jgi:hypothetical protein
MVQLSLASATVLNKLATSIISHKFGDHAYYLKVQYIVTIMRDVRELFALTRIVDFFDWRYRLARHVV